MSLNILRKNWHMRYLLVIEVTTKQIAVKCNKDKFKKLNT